VKYVAWDFDGTLAYHRRGMWSDAMRDLLSEAMPGLQVSRDDLRPYLATGFPWHTPERDHPELDTPEKWWSALNPVLERAYLAVGAEPELARDLSVRLRETYTDPANWQLFDDVIETLDDLSSCGWTHLVLSNHVPELPQIVEGLGLVGLIFRIFCSAESGYEKPNPGAFEEMLRLTRHSEAAWMVGDSMKADVAGAEAVGIPAVLVRTTSGDARRCCQDIRGVPAILDGP
jgi:putative hydrolase of the HAD superfamily